MEITSESVKPPVAVESEIFDAVKTLLQTIEDTHGIRVTSFNATWMDTSNAMRRHHTLIDLCVSAVK